MDIRVMPVDTHDGFILMDHTGLSQSLFNAAFDLGEGLRAGSYPLEQARCTNLEAEDLSEHLAGTHVRHHLALNQIHSRRLDTGS